MNFRAQTSRWRNIVTARVKTVIVLNPGLTATMNDAQLDMIAGEDSTTRRERERLKSETQGLEALKFRHGDRREIQHAVSPAAPPLPLLLTRIIR